VLIEETNTDVKENTGSKDKHTDTGTRKYSLLPAAAVQDSPSSLLYTTSDPSKALDVVMLPDPSERWELVVTPGTFSSVNTTINLTDGWQLASVGADSTNQVLGTVSDLAQAVVSATSQVDVAKIASDQAIQLQKLQNQAAQQADDDGSSLLDFESLLGPDEVAEYFYDHGLEVPDSPKPATPVQAGVRFLGYLRRVNLEVVRPGLYKVSDLGSPAVLPTVEAQYWQRVGI